ncbi:PREDICTED: rab-like protein 6 [Amphimedon queenslandica]|uniref:Rab-like protein 6 n=2 Tax=Amphimedon queenslandica TaxID=400682 RepID=A0A1X7UVL4_AMPQE|nr:PREDICTED: rab-like protein 6 [Amphimedon queenslandica]|eukprot:XP_011403974.2 PREDICTED: rab-like protein 6 [Amphimedon queenslandica]
MGNEGGKLLDTTTPEGVQAMDENLQRKFSKGIQYNMKVLIRGDRNTGKSCLFRRMQGKPFTESYIPTNEIQVGHIQWTYPCTNDMVKVEIWDVVDQGRSTKKGKDVPLKLSNEADASQDMALDASFLDVYKGAHCVVLMYDITKQWTWQYIERELQHIPLHLPIVVIGNYLDMREHRSVSMEDAEFYVTHLNRPEGAADIRYAESCMKNGYGLRYLHKFLSIPFLQLQQETLLHQLKTNREQIMLVSEGLDSKEDQDYDKFLSDRANPKAPKNRPVPEAPPTNTPPGHTPELPVKSTEKEMVKEPPPPKIPTEESTDGGSIAKKLSSRFTGFLSKSKTKEPTNAPSPKSPPGRPRQKSLGNVDDFVPEGELDDQFFEGGEGGGGGEAADDDSDSDEERVNPQVAMDEDLSSLEEEEEEPEPPPPPSKPTKKTTPVQPARGIPATKRIEESESESDEDGVQRPVVALDEDLSSPEEEEEKANHSTGMLQPTRAPVAVKATPPAPVKATPPAPRPLKSAHEIALTESEEEEEERPVVMMKDEDIPEPVSKVKSGGLLMTHQTQKPKSSGGLLLGHNDSSSPSAPAKEKKKSRKSSSSEKSHKKKRQKSRDGGEEGDKAAGSPVTPAPSDPFDFNSLDAWLGGDDSPSVQPRSTHGLSRALHKSIEENDEEEEEEPREKKKKKKKSDRDVGGDGSIKKKKRSKSKKSETTNIEDLF